MKVAFFSNFLNHHQLPLCEEFLNYPGVSFKFVALERTPKDRLNMGYIDMNLTNDFVVRGYEDYKAAMDIAINYDVVIFGNSSDLFSQERLKRNKISFRYIERPFKKGFWRYLIPRVRRNIKNNYLNYKDANLYILCASGFTSGDLVRCGFPSSKCFTWGYFPRLSSKSFEELLNGKNERKTFVYVGRLLKLKHVETIVRAFCLVNKNRKDCDLLIVGEGPEKHKLEKIRNRHHLTNITFMPFQSIDGTREIMEAAHFLIIASDFREGWAAVVNESLSSGCPVLASHSVGSSPILIKNGVNGYVFKLNNHKSLYSKMLDALNNQKYESLSLNAYKTTFDLFNAHVAVQRFMELVKCLGQNSKVDFVEGPCSPSPILHNNWIYKTK